MHKVNAKSILSPKNGMNLYRGCTHGCIYCDTRSTCYGMEHAFEDIEVKANAPQLLEQALKHKRKRCMIGTGSMCDPYMPIEQELGLTRQCLELIDRYRFGVSIITKSDLILRDGDRQYYYQKLDEHFPGLKQKYIEMYQNAYEVGSPRRRELMEIFQNACKARGLETNINRLFSYLYEFKDKQEGEQLSLEDFLFP